MLIRETDLPSRHHVPGAAVRDPEELSAFRGILVGVLAGGLLWVGLVKLVLSLS
jgi:hypothetical protein